MTFRTFFLITFILSISTCTIFTFAQTEVKTFSYSFNELHIDTVFISLTALITAIFSLIGLMVSTYFANKREKAFIEKQEKDRINLEKIHKELKEMGQ